MVEETANMVAIYALKDPAGVVRYVGKAKNPEARFKAHLRNAVKGHTPVYCWIRKLLEGGEAPMLEVIEYCQENVWEERERALISQYRESGRLLNVADGGDQPKREETPLKRRVWELNRAIASLLRAGRVNEVNKAKLRYAAAKRPDLFGRWATV